MTTMIKHITAVCLTLALLLSFTVSAAAAEQDTAALLQKSAAALLSDVPDPQCASVGGEWTVIGLARSGAEVPQRWYDCYYRNLEAYVKDCNGILHTRKYTEYSRVVLALTAIGRDPADVGGYDLLAPLGDFDKVILQGITGPAWALLALDSGGYAVPHTDDPAAQATRQRYVDFLLSKELPGGGFALSGTEADPDVTGMVMQALAPYREQTAILAAVDRALSRLSAMQRSDGGFSSWGTANSESCAQVLIALCTLGVSCDDSRFVKNGHTVADALLSYRLTDGRFFHVADQSGNTTMASEQGLCALAAQRRAETGQAALYRMNNSSPSVGLPGKHPDVQRVPVFAPGAAFPDVSGHPEQTAVEALASRGIINGMGNGLFQPDRTMTRAEFAAITVRALGLPLCVTDAFSDVLAGQWFAPYVGTACSFGIVNGVGNGRFNPSGTITRQEAAVMVARAGKLCGLSFAGSGGNELSRFKDAGSIAEWAEGGVEFCCHFGIWDGTQEYAAPARAILRGEIAQMLYALLDNAELL